MKYLEAESNFFLAVEQNKDMETIEALQMEVDRLEVFKPTSLNLVLSVEQVMSKIELFIETNKGYLSGANLGLLQGTWNSKIVKLTERISDCTKSSNKSILVNAKLNNQS